MSLDVLFRPRSIAVVGASRKRGTVGAEIFHNLLATGFPGAVYPFNPGTSAVQAVKAWPRVQDIPDPVDLAVVVVPKERVLEVVDDCGQAGVKALIVISAGFAETGRAGKDLQEQLVRRVRARGMRMVGPNCLGLLNTDPAVHVDVSGRQEATMPTLIGLSYSPWTHKAVRHEVALGLDSAMGLR